MYDLWGVYIRQKGPQISKRTSEVFCGTMPCSCGSYWCCCTGELRSGWFVVMYVVVFLVGNQSLVMTCDLFKVIFTLYHGKSPSNHHLGEYLLLFPSILSKSKYITTNSLKSKIPFLKKNGNAEIQNISRGNKRKMLETCMFFPDVHKLCGGILPVWTRSRSPSHRANRQPFNKRC